MSKGSEPERLGILWSYDNTGGTRWLPECVKAIRSQGFVWWDVGWKIKFEHLTFPITGYMWATDEKHVKYRAIIESGSKTVKQPDKALAREVEANWIKMKLPFGKNDRLHEFLNNDREELTLLKLSSIEELHPPMELTDFMLWDSRPLTQPPQGCSRIRLS